MPKKVRPQLTHTDYPFYSSNCTNFVSQCLAAGGLETNNKWNIDHGFTKRGWTYDPTDAWGTADGLYHYLVDNKGFEVTGYIAKGGTVASIIDRVLPGDVIFWNMYDDTDQDIAKGFMNHSAIITGIADGEIYYSGNSEPRRNEQLSGKYTHGDIYIVRIKYPNE